MYNYLKYCCFVILLVAIQVNAYVYKGTTNMSGSILVNPCSIALNSRYQTIDFADLSLPDLVSKSIRESQKKPFLIELSGCNIDDKRGLKQTWLIQFDGEQASAIDGFFLRGGKGGLGISIYDAHQQKIMPGHYYPIVDSILIGDHKGDKIYLRYFMNLELTGLPLVAGDYNGIVKFFIDYQ